MIDNPVAAFVALFVVVGPLEAAPVFLALTKRLNPAQRRRTAWLATAIAAGVLLAFALGGGRALAGIGISMPAFRVAGGILLLLVAVDFLFARASGLSSITAREEAEAKDAAHEIAVFPIAIPLLAGPGAMTGVVLLMDAAGGSLAAQAGVIAILALVMALTLAILWLAEAIVRAIGIIGLNVVSRVAGILLAALAVQFILDGVKASGVLG
jgi:multiple antibiotic resistance protein